MTLNSCDKRLRRPYELPVEFTHFDRLPDAAEVREPVVRLLYGCSSATVWRRAASGVIPRPRRRGSVTTWNVGELRAALAWGASDVGR